MRPRPQGWMRGGRGRARGRRARGPARKRYRAVRESAYPPAALQGMPTSAAATCSPLTADQAAAKPPRRGLARAPGAGRACREPRSTAGCTAAPPGRRAAAGAAGAPGLGWPEPQRGEWPTKQIGKPPSRSRSGHRQLEHTSASDTQSLAVPRLRHVVGQTVVGQIRQRVAQRAQLPVQYRQYRRRLPRVEHQVVQAAVGPTCRSAVRCEPHADDGQGG